MNHLTASVLLRSQFSGIRQMMNDMAELLLEAVKNREKSFTNRRKWVILRFEI